MDAFFNTILPVFAVVAAGAVAARFHILDREAAAMLNRFVFFIAVPALLFKVVVEAPFDQFEPGLALAFIGIELIVYASGVALGRLVFGLEWRAAVLVGFASAFVNHVLLVLPIAILLFGNDATPVIVAIITFDALVLMPATTLIIDSLSKETSRSAAAHALKSTATNPHIIAMALGFLLVALNLPYGGGLERFIGLLSGAAAPAALVSLGVILSRPVAGTGWALPGTVAALKLALHPLLAIAVIVLLGASMEEARGPLMVAAGPTGAMALVLATRYGLIVDDIARTILLTTIGALATVTLTAVI